MMPNYIKPSGHIEPIEGYWIVSLVTEDFPGGVVVAIEHSKRGAEAFFEMYYPTLEVYYHD